MPELSLPTYETSWVMVGTTKLEFLDDPPYPLLDRGIRCSNATEWEAWLRDVMIPGSRKKYDRISKADGCPWGIRRMRDIGVALLAVWAPHLFETPDTTDDDAEAGDGLGKSEASDT